MYNSAGQFSTFVENFFPRGRLFRPSRRGPSAPSSVNDPASGPSAPPWPWQVGRCIWVLARGADVFFPGRAGQRYNKSDKPDYIYIVHT